MHLVIIAGARPNFMKIAPIIRLIEEKKSEHDLSYSLVHTGQHYDKQMSEIFFTELGIPKPDVNLGVGSGSPAYQTGKIMIEFEKYIVGKKIDWLIVVGDVTSTFACSVVAKKANIKVAHIEAGLRSRDLQMPEEINRMLTDAVSDKFFTTTEDASRILMSEGKSQDQIHFVGNVMIDCLVNNLPKLRKPSFLEDIVEKYDSYFLLTLHRPSNVDEVENLIALIANISNFAGSSKVIFPVHPRTRKQLEGHKKFKNIHLVEPLPYFEFMYLVKNSKLVLTDSGGIQEETTFLGIPCATLRKNTERPETIKMGTNILIGDDMLLLQKSISTAQNDAWKKGKIPEYWDGKASQRIINILLDEGNS